MVLHVWGPPHVPSHPGEGQAQNHGREGGRAALRSAQEVPGPMHLWDEAALAVWLYTHKEWCAYQMVSAITPSQLA